MENIKRIILTHLHIDHAQATNEVRKEQVQEFIHIGSRQDIWPKIHRILVHQLLKKYKSYSKSLDFQ